MANVSCPVCGSEQVTANRRGFKGGAALAGDILVGPLGLLAGTAGQNQIVVTCLGCGFSWQAGRHKSAARAHARRKSFLGGMGCLAKWTIYLTVGGFIAVLAINWLL